MSVLTKKSLETFMQSTNGSRFPYFVTMAPESPLSGVFYFPDRRVHEIKFVRIGVLQDNSIDATDQEKRADYVQKEFLIPLKYGGLIRQQRKTMFGIDTILGSLPERIVLEDDSSLLNSDETAARNIRKGTNLRCIRVSQTRKLRLMDRNGGTYVVKDNNPLHFSAVVDLNPRPTVEVLLHARPSLPQDVKFDDVNIIDVASCIHTDFEMLRTIFRGLVQIKSIEAHEFYIGLLRTSSKHFTVSLIPRNVAKNWNISHSRRADRKEQSEYTDVSYDTTCGTKLFTKGLGVTRICISITGENSLDNIYIESLVATQPSKRDTPIVDAHDEMIANEYDEETEYEIADIEAAIDKCEVTKLDYTTDYLKPIPRVSVTGEINKLTNSRYENVPPSRNMLHTNDSRNKFSGFNDDFAGAGRKSVWANISEKHGYQQQEEHSIFQPDVNKTGCVHMSPVRKSSLSDTYLNYNQQSVTNIANDDTVEYDDAIGVKNFMSDQNVIDDYKVEVKYDDAITVARHRSLHK